MNKYHTAKIIGGKLYMQTTLDTPISAASIYDVPREGMD